MFTPPSRRWRATLLACGVAAALSACGGGGGGSSPVPTDPPPDPITVRSSTPAEGATGVARDVRPELTLSQAVSADQVGFACAGQAVAAQVAGGTTVRVTPAARLLPLAKCQVQVANGPALTFTTADGAWAAAQGLENGTGDAQEPNIAVNAQGRAVAVWHHIVNFVGTVQASVYVPGSGWSTPHSLGLGTNPEVATDASGHAIAAWGGLYNGTWSLWTSRHAPDGGWTTAEVMAENIDRMRVAMNAQGDAVVTWMQVSPVNAFFDVYANRYVPGSGWQGAQKLEQVDRQTLDPVPAVAPDGTATVVWQQSDGTLHHVVASQSGRTGVWSPPLVLDTSTTGAGDASIVASSDGSFLAHWVQLGDRFEVWSTRFQPGTGWGTAQRISDGSANANSAQVSINGAGEVIAMWVQDGATSGGIHSRRYVPGSGWGATQRIGGTAATPEWPHVALDDAGNALVVWRQWLVGSGWSTYASRQPAGGTWGAVQRLGGPEIVDTGLPRLAMDGSGSAIAIWSEYDGSTRSVLRFNRFD